MTRLLSLTLVLLLATTCTSAQDDPLIAEDQPEQSAETVRGAVRTGETVETTPAPTPTPTQETTVTSTTDGTEPTVLIEGEGWIITEDDLIRLRSFVELTHELSFTQEVGVRVDPDIGAAFALGFEAISTDAWTLLRVLNLVDLDADRSIVNSVRRDRIRGVCCDGTPAPVVVVEVQPTKLGTELVIVHELTHALHFQNIEFDDRTEISGEVPEPAAASFEGVPQFVSLAYLATQPPELQEMVASDLPVIPAELESTIGTGASHYLNFVYGAGPTFIDQIVQDRGAIGLSEVLLRFPTSTEQVLFTEKYLTNEAPQSIPSPEAPANATLVSQGTIGAAALLFALGHEVGSIDGMQLVEHWAGDAYIVYELAGASCLSTTIRMDGDAAAGALAAALLESLADSNERSADVIGSEIALTSCPR